MTSIVWDDPATRLFETGLDRGVLYLADGVGVPWNGLVSIEESFDETNATTYLDGVKASDIYPPGDFKGKLTAFTYPDEFLLYQGIEMLDNSGMAITGQDALTFGLSYRTLVGNDVEGTDYGYQLHLLYNLIAVTEDVEYSTYSTSPDVADFSWSITATPSLVDGFRPTAHVIIDSRAIAPALLTYIEDILYGSLASLVQAAEMNDYEEYYPRIYSAAVRENFDTTIPPYPSTITELIAEGTPTLPPLNDLLSVVLNFDSMILVPDYDTGISELVSGYGDLTSTKTAGLLSSLPNSRLTASVKDGYYTLTNG